MSNPNNTTISVSIETRDALKQLGTLGDTYDSVIRMLLAQ